MIRLRTGREPWGRKVSTTRTGAAHELASARRRSYRFHAAWVALALTANPIERALRRHGAPEGAATGVVAAGWYATLFLAERRHPFRPEWNPDRREAATDAAFLGITTVAALGGQAALAHRRGADRAAPVARLGIVGGLVASLLTSDLIHYTLHRIGHQWGPAWTVHSVHHSPMRLHILNATRFHPVEMVTEGVLEGVALGAVGFTPAQLLTHATARSTYGQLQHCNIDLDSGPIDHVLATPDLHRWHHSDVYAEGDNNYGAVVSVWDRLFGTFFRPERPLDATLGIGRMPRFPQQLGALLTVPLRWNRIRERNAATWYRDGRPGVRRAWADTDSPG